MFDAYITRGDHLNVLPQEFSAKLPKKYKELSAMEYDLWINDLSMNIAHKFRSELAALRPGGGHVPQS